MSQTKKLLSFILLFIFKVGVAQADSLSISFNDNFTAGTGDLIFNKANQTLHGPIEIRDYQAVAGPVSSYDVSIGDGSHGSFDSSTYSNFSENGDVSGNIIRLNTDTYPILKVTKFELDSGWTLEPIGSKPLIIYSQSTVVVNGTIQCSGRKGNSADADETIQVSGVEGRCGGAASGAGGYDSGGTLVDADNGTSGGTNLVAGGGADSTGVSAAKGGGGGGAYAIVQAPQNSTAGVNPDGGAGGSAGTSFRDDAFSFVFGGSGGGGGAGFRTGTVTQNASGASGGSGGGLVIIHAYGNVSVSNTGTILANGGDGGDVAAGLYAGAGGGGGGGGVKIFSAGDVVLDGAVRALEGAAGNSPNGGNGGKGGRGRTWISDSSGRSGGSVFEDPDTLLTGIGTIEGKQGSFSLETGSYDLKNSLPSIDSENFTTELSGGTFSLTYSSSLNEDGGSTFISRSSLNDLNSFRYWKFKVSLNQDASGGLSSTSIIDITYTPKSASEFDFEGACGLVYSVGKEGGPHFSFWFLLILPLILLVILRFRILPVNF